MAAKDQSIDPVTYESDHASLTLQDSDRFPDKDFGIWAQFVEGRFTTSDPAVVELLDQVADVRRVDVAAEQAAADEQSTQN